MENGTDPSPWLQIAPLGLLILVAVYLVTRGLRAKRHDKGNIKGGGPDILP